MSKTKKALIGVPVFLILVLGIALFATSGIAGAANKQLDYLKAEDFVSAYALTSKDFQSATSLEDFIQFVNATPSLKNNESASFTTRSADNNEGTLKGTLKSRNGTVTPVEYALVKENNEWKILSVQLSPTGATTREGRSIDQILISDTADANGQVSVNKTDFLPATNEIFVSAFIKGANKGSQASAEIVYLATGEKAGPVANDIERSGDLISNFSFTKPTADWAEGSYKIVISLSTGESKETSFSVVSSQSAPVQNTEGSARSSASQCYGACQASMVSCANSQGEDRVCADAYRSCVTRCVTGQ